MIFDNSHLEDDSPKKNGESYFQFFNRSSRIENGKIRCFLEDLISRFPFEDANELIGRIRSRDDANFISAVFELFLHEALVKIGCGLSVHPELHNGKSTRPDFLVKTPDGCEFYLEAVLATERNESDKGGEARKGIVLDCLSSSPHRNFRVLMDDKGCPNTQPSGKKITREVHNWLDTLDPDDIQNKIDSDGFAALTSYGWCHEDWQVNFMPIPISAENRGKSTNLIGIGAIGNGGWIDSWSPIRDAVEDKGSKYGILDKPLLIAVNVNSFHLDEFDEMQALFGQEQLVLGAEGPRKKRVPNGAWWGKKGTQYTRVSGVWIFNFLLPTSVAKVDQTVYFNPWATHTLPDILKKFPHAIAEDDKICRKEGISFAKIFGLNKNWPE